MDNKQYIVVIKSGAIASILSDIVTFGGFMAMLWFNHAYLSGNILIDITFIVIWILIMATKQSNRYHTFKSKQDAIKYLQEAD